MTEAEQAAMYEAGVKAQVEASAVGKADPTYILIDAMEDHMVLEALYADNEKEARRMAYKERGAMLMRGVDDRDYFLRPANDFFAEMTMLEYAEKDAALSMAIFERWVKAKRLAAQRPLIHNGRKYRK